MDATTEPTPDAKKNAAEFDIDAWISGATKPERSVTIYQDGRAYADFEQAHAEWNDLSQRRSTRDNDDSGHDPSLSDADPLDEELREVADRMRDSLERARERKVTLRFRAEASRTDYVALMKRHAKALENDPQVVYYHLAAKCFVGQKSAASSWKKMRAVIGDGQWAKIVKAIDGACLSEDVTPDFSLPLSLFQPTPTSSQN